MNFLRSLSTIIALALGALSATALDLSRATIVLHDTSPVGETAATVLVEEVQRRTGITLPVVKESPATSEPAIYLLSSAQVDATNTLPPETPASVGLTVTGGTLHFTFDIPQGQAGAAGSEGPQGIQGQEGPQGMPGEVSLQQLTDAIATTSSNSNYVSTLEMTVNDPPTQGEVQLIANKLDELITALRR